jgi:hypothetical protein
MYGRPEFKSRLGTSSHGGFSLSAKQTMKKKERVPVLGEWI